MKIKERKISKLANIAYGEFQSSLNIKGLPSDITQHLTWSDLNEKIQECWIGVVKTILDELDVEIEYEDYE